MLLLAHGQCISVYHLYKKEWYHYFNTDHCADSNKCTELINSQNSLNNSFEDNDIYSAEGEEENQEALRLSCHSYFNRKSFEVTQISFMPNQSANFYEFLVSM